MAWQRITSQFANTWLWRWGRPALRLGRVGVASGTLYMLGYSSGLRSALEDRESAINDVMVGVLKKQAGNAQILPSREPASLKVSRLGAELISAADAHLQHLIEMEPATDPKDDPRVAKLDALQKLKWHFLVIDDDSANAFVADLLPGYVFVHRGLVQAMDDDQLSFTIAHELSHYLCEHSTTRRGIAGIFSIVQIVVLAAVDPTGLVSLLLELPVASSLFDMAVTMPISRQHEAEADAMGLSLVARACRDPKRAIRAHEELANIEARNGGSPDYAGPLATHPSTLERLEQLRLQLPDAVRTYEKAGCDKVKAALKKVGLGGLAGSQ